MSIPGNGLTKKMRQDIKDGLKHYCDQFIYGMEPLYNLSRTVNVGGKCSVWLVPFTVDADEYLAVYTVDGGIIDVLDGMDVIRLVVNG